MKKTFFALMLMLVSVVTINAQTLTSNPWMTVLPGNDNVVVLLSFDNDGTCALVIANEEVQEEDVMKLTITVTAMIPGAYTLNGDNLNIKLDKEKADLNFDYEIEGVDGQAKKMVEAMLKPELEKQKPMLKNEVLKSIPDMGNLTIVSLSNDELVLANEDGEELTFKVAPEE